MEVQCGVEANKSEASVQLGETIVGQDGSIRQM